jgi:Zn-dependent protease
VLLDPNPSIGTFIAIGLIFLVALPFHEFSHALAATVQGDPTSRFLGRLTLNPLAHIDPIGGLMILLVGFGWAKPTPYNPLNLRYGRAGEALVAFAGPASNLVLAVAAALPLRYIYATGMDVPAILETALVLWVYLNLLLMVFNLLPIPPLDGSKVLFALMDPRTERQYRPTLEQYGPFLLLLLVVFGSFGGFSPLSIVFREIVDPLFQLITGRGF